MDDSERASEAALALQTAVKVGAAPRLTCGHRQYSAVSAPQTASWRPRASVNDVADRRLPAPAEFPALVFSQDRPLAARRRDLCPLPLDQCGRPWAPLIRQRGRDAGRWRLGRKEQPSFCPALSLLGQSPGALRPGGHHSGERPVDTARVPSEPRCGVLPAQA